ncbi:hypothetical protein AK95_14670 [Paenibacillus sp. LC231]|uniref:hypothetical protein n=1 Tax=Paenibacillus sp. LC231 TaxID=1120679 RepID=UPI0008DE28A8|nr:hypothetical protein [Paenibacillus sp. LC231]OIB04856.1 hypothetical protein AK95_14670 [Paenibacillus sp. LC231]
MRSSTELFSSFRESLTPEAQKDIDRLLFLYDWFLDETDPATRETIKGELSILEKKYNLVTDHTKKAAQ